MAVTERQLLEVILANGSQPGEVMNALSILKRVTGLDREKLVEKYLKPKTARSTNRKTKAELEEDLNEAYRCIIQMKGQLQSALHQVEVLKAKPSQGVVIQKPTVPLGWKVIIYMIVVVMSQMSVWLGLILVIMVSVLITAKELGVQNDRK